MVTKRGARTRHVTRFHTLRSHAVRSAIAAALALLLGAVTINVSYAAGTAGSRASAASASDPAVTGPITGGTGAIGLYSTAFDLGQVGYEQSEYFLSGTAAGYQPVSPLTSDGAWTVTAASNAPYTTRIVVYRPQNPLRFNGTVVVEWLNVSGGLDIPATWIAAHNELIREGYAWVGISAQAAGVAAAKATDPVRYAALSHPGDSYSYDMYSQAGQAVRDNASTVLGGLQPRKVLGIGESQSAFRLTTYVDAVQPLVHVYDGFLIYSREGTGAPLSQAPQADVPDPAVVHIRTDLGVPVLAYETETDLLTLGYLAARQRDSADFRDWEVAGTSHADAYTAAGGFTDTGNGQGDVQSFNTMLTPPTTPNPAQPVVTCGTPINTGEMHYVVEAALNALNLWTVTGIAPLPAPRLTITTTGSTPSFVLDANGNVQGGIRTPAVDVPVATLSGLGQTGTTFCFLFGTTVPFTAAKLATLYPTHTQFIVAWATDLARDTIAGYIRPADAAHLLAAAAASTVGG